MNHNKKYFFFFLSSVLVASVLSACSQDEGDGKDEKSKLQMQLMAQKNQLSASQCQAADELRNQCYLELLKNSPEAINDLGGKNPFLLKSWDETDFSTSLSLAGVSDCRTSFISCSKLVQ